MVTEGAVPVSAPEEDNVSHAGRFPADHVSAPVPPDEASVCE